MSAGWKTLHTHNNSWLSTYHKKSWSNVMGLTSWPEEEEEEEDDGDDEN
jgi:hypothetical protein